MGKFKLFALIALVLVIAAGALTGVYAVAETIAISASGGFGTNAAQKQSRLAELDAAVRQSVDTYQHARTHCRMLTSSERSACISSAKSAQQQTKDDATLIYHCSNRRPQFNSNAQQAIPNNIVRSDVEDDHYGFRTAPRNSVATDTALYLIHRQFSR